MNRYSNRTTLRTTSSRRAAPMPTLPGWLRAVLYGVALVLAQSLLSRLFAAIHIPPPDLFLLTGVALALRWPPIAALLTAYALGLLQDILGAGSLGIHAAALAGGTLLVLLTRRVAPSSQLGQVALGVVAGMIGQWLTFMLLTYWLRTGLVTPEALGRTLPLSFITTLLIAPLWDVVSDFALGQERGGLD